MAFDYSEAVGWLNANEGFLTFILFVLTLLLAWISGFFQWLSGQISKRTRASKIICAWRLFPDSENGEFYIFKFSPNFQNKTDEVIKDFWINYSSSGFEMSLTNTPQMALFDGWNHRGDALNLVAKENYRFAPQNFLEPFEITIKLRKTLPHHGAWIYLSYGVPEAKKVELNFRLSYTELNKFVNSTNPTGENFLKYIGASKYRYLKLKLFRLFFK